MAFIDQLQESRSRLFEIHSPQSFLKSVSSTLYRRVQSLPCNLPNFLNYNNSLGSPYGVGRWPARLVYVNRWIRSATVAEGSKPPMQRWLGWHLMKLA